MSRATPSNRRLALGLIILSVLSGAAARFALNPLQEIAKADLSLTDSSVGLVQGLALAIPVAILAIPIGRIVDRGSRVRLLLALAACWTVGTALTAMASGFLSLFAARMIVGIGVAGATPAAVSIAADISIPERRGRVMMLLSLGQVAGGAFSFALVGGLLAMFEQTAGVPLIAGLSPWRLVLLLIAAMLLLILVPVAFIREPKRLEIVEHRAITLRVALTELYKLRRLILPIIIGIAASGMAMMAATVWAAPVLTRSFALEPAQFAGWMSGLFLIGGVAGTLLGGFITDWAQRRGGRSAILSVSLAGALLLAPAGLFPLMPTALGFATLFGLFILSASIISVSAISVVVLLIPNELRGLCMSLIGAFGAVTSLGAAPSLVSLISSATGGESSLPRALAAVNAATGFIAAVAFAYACWDACKQHKRSPLPAFKTE